MLFPRLLLVIFVAGGGTSFATRRSLYNVNKKQASVSNENTIEK
jgi:hypothetical protein